ncbi:hypothetical protein [Streptococcus acidominimus]|uniref:Uncharacterized protein n=1 Tax=Streptococcus acidominimus TaxID=1326 RepID=A0A1Q8EBB5_STRAI|nr:hypothetical protein [Streptococcus acidominimus]OLF49075.1 hypothetical protein BU200_09290 [Streptococcus acidominimus]SUN06817.1 Uncharacterised protein [Streptococcus acidominimus]
MVYQINSTLFITESYKSIFIFIDEKIYKLNKAQVNRSEIDEILDNVRNCREIDTKLPIFQYLVNIGALVAHNKVTKLSKILINNKTGIITDSVIQLVFNSQRYNSFFKIVYEGGYNIKISPLDNNLIIYKGSIDFLDDIENLSMSNEMLEYILEVLISKLKDLSELDIENKIITIDLRYYTNKLTVCSLNKLDKSNYLFSSCLAKNNFDFESYYPMIRLEHQFISGHKIVLFGENKEECIHNLFLSYGIDKEDINYKLEQTNGLSPKVFAKVLNFYFPKIFNREQFVESSKNNGQIFKEYYDKAQL